MDKLVTTGAERFWNPEAYARDQFVKAEAAKLPAGSRVLDVGAGASKYRPFFAHCHYETQDFCKYAGALVRYREPIDYVCDVLSIPLPDGCLDAIVCTEVFEHVVDPMSALAEFNRLLKPAGRLILTAPFVSYLHMEPYHYYSGFTAHWYEYWLPRKGFALDSISPVGGPGRSCVVFCQNFYGEWSAAEKKLRGWRRLVSLVARAVAKLLAHYLLPRLLPNFDSWLGPKTVCSEYLVAARRASDRP